MSSASSLDQVTNVERFGFSASSSIWEPSYLWEWIPTSSTPKTLCTKQIRQSWMLCASSCCSRRFACCASLAICAMSPNKSQHSSKTVTAWRCTDTDVCIYVKNLSHENTLSVSAMRQDPLVLTITLDSETTFQGSEGYEKILWILCLISCY